MFMIRELTCVFVAGYAVFLMVLLYQAGRGPEAFRDFYHSVLLHPLSIVLHLIVLAFVVFHSVTWLNLTPKVMIVWRGEEKVPPAAIAGGHYVLWLVLSVIVLGVVFVARG